MSLTRARGPARKGRRRGRGSVSDHMTHQELATSPKSFGVQGLLPGSRRYIQKFARRCPDRFGAGLQPPDKVKHSLVDLLGSLLLGPMTATWQQESSPKLPYKLRQVGDDLVHPTKGQNEIAVPGDVQRRNCHLHSRDRR